MKYFNSKSQAPLELFATYWWVLVVIFILISALWYFGILSPNKLFADRCIISPDITCVNFKLSETDAGTGVLRLKLKNNFPESIVVTSWEPLAYDKKTLTCESAPGTGLWTSGEIIDVEFTGCDNEAGGIVLREKYKVGFKLNYYPATATSIYSKEIEGEVFATVTTIESLLSQPECNDDADNDHNGCIDWDGGDTGCSSSFDTTESGGFCPGGSSDPGGGGESDDLDCFVSTACSDTIVFKMSALEDAHAEIPSGANYDYKACCRSATDTLSSSCPGDETALHLSSNTDAHVEDGAQSSFNVNVCLSAGAGTVSCSPKANCDAAETCMATISAITDAHVADCSTNPYATKICCSLT